MRLRTASLVNERPKQIQEVVDGIPMKEGPVLRWQCFQRIHDWHHVKCQTQHNANDVRHVTEVNSGNCKKDSDGEVEG